MELDFEKLSVNDLKVMVYDESIKLQTVQTNLQTLNQAIAEKQQPKKVDLKEIAKKKIAKKK